MKDFQLNRFINAQKSHYSTALKEIQNGHKQSHWIWYIFPQIAGLGCSPTSQYYAISSLDEAKAYMNEPTLKEHLLEISYALMELKTNNPTEVMGYPDDMKLRSSMTLFAYATPEYDVFEKVLNKYFHDQKDQKTLDILKHNT